MKRHQLIKKLSEMGCILVRHGGIQIPQPSLFPENYKSPISFTRFD